jgi:sugar phosphate isomerase/epimerase
MRLVYRRQFLHDATLALAGLGAGFAGLVHRPRHLNGNPLGLPIGLELYTVRALLKKDFEGTLKRVAAVGYKEVELFSFLGRKPSQIKQSLTVLGLSCPSSHYETPELKSGWERHIADAKELGLTYMVCAFLHPRERRSLDDYKSLAELFNKSGEQCKKAGLQLCYHNHNFEFTKFDGVLAFDELLRLTDAELVKIELDCYWMTRAGHDPVHYLGKYPGRFPLLHIKDMKPGQQPTTDLTKGSNAFTEVGRGSIDWKRIFEAAPQGGVKHYFVEQDTCALPALESIKISYEYLKNLSA